MRRWSYIHRDRKEMVELIVPGKPLGWRAPFVGARGAFTPRTPIMGQIRALLKQQYDGPLLDGHLATIITFYMPIPKATSIKKRKEMMDGKIFPTGTPDLGNLEKFASDYLQTIVYENDSVIVESHCQKKYDENPRTVIRILSFPKEKV
jgi:Holliday junction resolvase RusA-like endonuclease